jgi:hypothetical protein
MYYVSLPVMATLQPFAELRVQTVFFFLMNFASDGSILNHFPWEYAYYVGIESPEGMASSDFLMAHQIA